MILDYYSYEYSITPKNILTQKSLITYLRDHICKYVKVLRRRFPYKKRLYFDYDLSNSDMLMSTKFNVYS